MDSRISDELSRKILKIIKISKEPLETAEIEGLLKKETRTKIFYRLSDLRSRNLVKGKMVGSGKGTWIWWNPKK